MEGGGCPTASQEVACSLQDLKVGRRGMRTGPLLVRRGPAEGRRKEAEYLEGQMVEQMAFWGALSGPPFQTREKNWAQAGNGQGLCCVPLGSWMPLSGPWAERA